MPNSGRRGGVSLGKKYLPRRAKTKMKTVESGKKSICSYLGCMVNHMGKGQREEPHKRLSGGQPQECVAHTGDGPQVTPREEAEDDEHVLIAQPLAGGHDVDSEGRTRPQLALFLERRTEPVGTIFKLGVECALVGCGQTHVVGFRQNTFEIRESV